MRVFAAIGLPPHVRDHLAQALAMVGSPRRMPRNPWTPSDNWHITLAFYGERPEDMTTHLLAHLAQVAAGTAPFRLALTGSGTFRHDVCWIGVADPSHALTPLADQTRSEFVTADQHAHNRFHVTISYAGRRADLGGAMAALSVYRGPEWAVNRITLMRSDLGEGAGGHPLYTTLGEVGLTGDSD